MTAHGLDEGWRDYATQRQAECMDAWQSQGSARKAADVLGIAHSNVVAQKIAIQKKMRMAGANKSELASGIAKPPFLMKGTSTLVNKHGEAVMTWYKTRIDEQQKIEVFREQFLAAIEDMPQAPVVPISEGTFARMASLYVIADLHLGHETSIEETNGDSDTESAIADLKHVIGQAVAQAPRSELAIIAQLGDFFEADNASNRTSRSGNQCHSTTNREMLMRRGCFALIYAVECAKEKHETVVLISKPGNHDDETALALSIMLEMYYRNDERVRVITDARYLTSYEYGANLLVFAHGHGAKAADTPIMAAQDFRLAWGRTKYTAVHTGHVHHMRLEEIFGVPVETHSALSKPSKYANERFRSGRYFQRIDYCYDEGEKTRWKTAL
jgi:metallophosphoesterase superfamily enzyme